MKNLKRLIFCITIVIALFYTIAYAETDVKEYGDYTYDDSGNVTIGGYVVDRTSFDDFLSYVGETYSVTAIKLENSIYEIQSEAFSSCGATLREITMPLNMNTLFYNIFGETHNVQIKYAGNEELWSWMYKENDDEYYGNVEFYSSGYASISGMGVEAYQDKVFGTLNFDFVGLDCVAEFEIYTCNDDGEKVLDKTYTLDIPANTDTPTRTYSIEYAFDYTSDSKDHFVSVALYDNLTNRTQWGEVCEREFFAYDNALICEYMSADVYNAELELFMNFLLVENDSVAFVEIFDYDEDGDLVLNKSLTIDIPANTEEIEHKIPFTLDNKQHHIKVSFYDNMTSKNELFDSMTYDFTANREYNGFLFDYIDENTVKITGYNGWTWEFVLPSKILTYTVTEIAENAFADCTGVNTVIIPKSYTKIGNGAFNGCTDLMYVKYMGSETEWENITIAENNENLTNAELIYDYEPQMYAFWGYEYDGENLIVSWSVDNCYKECLAKIELVNISKNETTILYYEIEEGIFGEEIIIPLANYDETYRVYGSIVSIDKTTSYTTPSCFAFFTPYEDKEVFTEGDFEYTVKNNEATITRYYGNAASINIPDTLGDYPVTTLLGWSFSGCEMTDITIGKNIKKIGYGALSYCFNLKNIIIDDENKNFVFENGVLYNVDKTELLLYLLTNTATEFTIPDSVTIIGAHAFEAVQNLKAITISKNVKRIERQAFAYSEISGELILPEGLESIGSEALCACFTKIHIPNSVTLIARDAVYGTQGLTEITVSEENQNYIAVDGVFYNKDKTLLIKYPDSKADQSFKMPTTVTEINEAAFMGTTNLVKVVLPQDIKVINDGAFSESSAKAIFYLGTESEFNKILVGNFNEDFVYNRIIGDRAIITDDNFRYEITSDVTAVIGCLNKLSGYISIPEAVNEVPVDAIGEYAFKGQDEITTLYISKNIKTFNMYYAFEGLDGLEKFEIDENNGIFVTDENGILYNKDKTKLIKYPASNPNYTDSYIIPECVETILPFAFSGSSFNEIIINGNVKSISRYSFVNMYSLKNFVVNSNQKFTSVNGVLYTADGKTLIQYPCGKTDTSFVVPDIVINIAQDAFRNSWGLQTITLPLGLENIGEYAFYDCENLISITIPSGVVDIKPYTFHRCLGLSEVTFSDSITTVGMNAFGLCSNLGNVNFVGIEDEYDNINVHASNTYLANANVSYVTPSITIDSQSAGVVSFKVNYVLSPAKILVAYYEDGVFSRVDERAYIPDKIETLTIDSTFDYEKDAIKVMVWDGLSTLKPLCDALELGKEKNRGIYQ